MTGIVDHTEILSNVSTNNAVINDINRMTMKCSIIAHQEKEFHAILQLDGYEPEDFMESLNLKDNIQNVFKAGQGAGESGSFFFFSKD